MDRAIVYIGQVPMDTDILYSNLNPYLGLAKLAACIMGTSTQLNGLACNPTLPASMEVTIAPGEIYQLAAIDTSAYGSLPINSTQILKQGVMLTTYTTPAFTAPSTVGYSQNFLIEFQLSELDGGSTVLPYYNSANPSQAFSGPNNDSQPNYTIRQDQVGIQIKAGTAAPSGTQTTPSPDAGYVGGWVITIAHGQTTITNSNIALYANAPFIPGTISNFVTQTNLQNSYYTYALDSSVSANTITVSLTPSVTAYTVGLSLWVKVANSNTAASTLNVNGLGSKNIKYENGSALNGGEMTAGGIHLFTYDGTNFQLINPVFLISNLQNQTYIYASDTGSANAYAIALTPALSAYVAGQKVSMKAANTNTSASTINVNSLGTKNIKLKNGGALVGQEIQSGGIYELQYDGTNFQLLNPFIQQGKLINIQVFPSSATYTPTDGTANAFVECWGGGGGGGSTNNATIIGSGGGGGAYAAGFVSITGTVSVTIGAGGNGGAANGNNGVAGGNTSFGSSVIAVGGGAGGQGATQGGAGGAAGSCTGTIKITGGVGGPSGNGSGSMNTTAGNSWGGAAPKIGICNASVIGQSSPSNSGIGGNGGSSGTNAGNGGSGYCVVWEYA